jgi:hypothetical protein
MRWESKILLAAAILAGAVVLSPLPAAAEELNLRCEFVNYRCSPEIYRIDLNTGVVTSFGCGSAPWDLPHRAQISHDAIVVPGRDGTFLAISRVTGDATIMQRWRGTCKKVEGRVIP